MDTLKEKTFTTSRQFTYTYYHSVASSGEARPTLLLQHGFPDDHSLWAKVVPYLLKLPYSILVPDLLGYNGTSKPTDPSLYNSKGMAQDLVDILDHEGIQKVISVGHDWGSFIAQRLYLWHRERVAGLILLNVAYLPPTSFNLTEVNATLEKYTGLPRYAYWELFTASDGVEILESNLESLFAACYGAPENWMETLFCHRGAIRDFIINDKRVPLMSYAEEPSFKDKWLARYKRDGFQGPLNWYRALNDGHQWAVEKDLDPESFGVNVPVLFVGATGDAVCQTAQIYQPQQAGLLPDLVIEEVTSSHWQTYEVPDKTFEHMAQWLKEKDFK
jgi:soluble epoxide hydrolase/lipid-phosphate phosphatase